MSLEELARLSVHHSLGPEEPPTGTKTRLMIRWQEHVLSGLSTVLSAVGTKKKPSEGLSGLRGPRRMYMIIVHSFRSLQETFETRASEWALTGVILSLSLVFFLNESMFYRSTFNGLREIMESRYGWASILAFVGIMRFSVLVVNGAYWRTPHFRAASAFLSAGVWFLLFAGFAQNGSIMFAIMPWIFFLDAYNTKRASREAGKSEYIQRYLKKKQEQKNAGVAFRSQR